MQPVWEVSQNPCSVLNGSLHCLPYYVSLKLKEHFRLFSLEANLEAPWLSAGFELSTVKALAPRYSGRVMTTARLPSGHTQLWLICYAVLETDYWG